MIENVKCPLGTPDFEKNGLRAGERVCHEHYPDKLGTVLYCAEDGVQVRWDDGQIGDAVWDQTVAYDAYRLQIVRIADRTRAQARLIEWAKSERDDWSERNADRFWQMNRVVAKLEAALAAVSPIPRVTPPRQKEEKKEDTR